MSEQQPLAVSFNTDTRDHEKAQLSANKDYDPAADPVVRASGIGGSDASSILGMNEHRSNLQAYAELRGEWPEDLDRGDPFEYMRMGSAFEAPICDMQAEDLGVKIQRVRQTMRLDGHPHIMAHPDRRIVGGYKGKAAFMEAKMTGLRYQWGHPGTDEVPDHVRIQTQQQMLCGDAELVVVAVLFVSWNRTREYYVVERDPDWQDILTQAEDGFWFNHVLTGVPPDVNFQDRATQDAIEKLHGNFAPDSFVHMDFEAQRAREIWEYHKQLADQHSKGADAARAEMVARMGPAQYGQFPGDGMWLRTKKYTRKGYTVEEQPVVDTRLVKNLPKGVEPPADQQFITSQ